MNITRGSSAKTCVAVFITSIIGVTALTACSSGSNDPKPAVSVFPERGVAAYIVTDKTTKALTCDTATVASTALVNNGTVANSGATITTAFDKTTVTVVVVGQPDYVSGIAYGGDDKAVAFNIPEGAKDIILNAEKDFKEVAPIKGVTLCGGGM